MPTLTTTERDRINERISDAVKKTKRKSAATTNGNGAHEFPPERGDRKGENLSLQGASALMQETMRKAFAAAGVSSEAEFRALPKGEQNAFLAQASGQQRTGIDPNEERRMLSPGHVFRSSWNRTHFDEHKMEELVASVKLRGVLQDVLVRPAKRELLTIAEQILFDDLQQQGVECFELIYGERRWRAATIAEVKLPAKIRRNCSDEEAIELQAVENLQREDPNPIETAVKYQQLLEVYSKRGLTRDAAIEEIRKRCGDGDANNGPSRSAIYDALRLLKLPEEAKKACLTGKLPPTHARELSKLEHDPEELKAAFDRVTKKQKDDAYDTDREGGLLSMRETKALVQERLEFLESRAEYRKLRSEFEAKGLRVLTDNEQAKLVGSSGERDYLRHDQKEFVMGGDTCSCIRGANWREWKALWGKHEPPRVLAMAPSGRAVILYEIEAAKEAVKAAGKIKPDPVSRQKKSPEEIEREQRIERRQVVCKEVIRRIGADVPNMDPKPGPYLMRAVARAIFGQCHYRLQVTCALRGVKTDEQMEKLIDELQEPEARALVLQMLAEMDDSDFVYDSGDGQRAKDYLRICKLAGVNVEKIEKDVAKQSAAAAAEEVQSTGRKGKK